MSSLLRRLFSHNVIGSRHLLSPRKFCSVANRELVAPSSLLRRLFSHKSGGSRHLLSPKKFSSAATSVAHRELVAPSSPWLMLPSSFTAGGERGDMAYNFYSPVKERVMSFTNRGGKDEAELMRSNDTVLVGSSHGWLALYNSRTHGLCLSNPLSGRRIDLPPMIGKPFRDEEEPRCPFKVILSCSPHDDDCRALMLLGTCDRAAFCRPGRSNEWSPLGRWYDDPFSVATYNDYRSYSDFVYSAADRNFLGLVLSWKRSLQELEGWDVTDPVRPRTVRLDRFGPASEPGLPISWLVCGEQPDQLFVVRRMYLVNPEARDINHVIDRENVSVNVYRIKDGELELCSSLDDLVMFVGINHSVAVKASQCPQLKPNSIYFSYARKHYGQFIGIFDYQNKRWSTIYHPTLLPQDPAPHSWLTPTMD